MGEQKFFTRNKTEKASFLQDFASSKNIVITTHFNPDGDAFGSSLGLLHVLEQLGKKVTLISPSSYANYIAWLPGVENIVVFEEENQEPVNQLIASADLMFCLDFSAFNRLNKMQDLARDASAKKVLIDHHENAEGFPDYYYYEPKASSTCELVYRLIEDLGWTNYLNEEVAICLYTGLVTDSGSFRFDSTTAEVHRIASELLKLGAKPNQIHSNLFDNVPLSKLRLMGYALSEKLIYLEEFKTSYISLSAEELAAYNSVKGDTEGLVNYGLSVEGAAMSAIFIERDEMIKISFRSNTSFSVSEFSRNHFNGGGHQKAAGGMSTLTLEKTLEKFKSELSNYKKELNKK